MIKFLTPAIAERYRGMTCLLRIDLNVEAGAEDATNRVDAILPTLRLLLKHNIRVVLLSHRGRPTRRTPALSLKPFASILAKKLWIPVRFVPDTNLSAVHTRIMRAKERVVLLENLRFWKGEEENSAAFAKRLASLADFYPVRSSRASGPEGTRGKAASATSNGMYVNDAFAVSHRKNASVVAITKFLPSYGGLRLKEEVERLDEVTKNPKHPFTVVVGGAKVGDKLRSLRGLLKKADIVLLGSSVFAEGDIPNLPRLSFPDDIKAHGDLAWDIGPWTMERYRLHIAKAKTIVWNGPVGFYEKKGFTEGTRAVWKAVLANKGAHTVIGGGETVASLQLITHDKKLMTIMKSSVISRKLFVSTGGGAMLAYLSGEKLPGIEALRR